MRILLVVLSPVSAELGGSQMALNLGDALRRLGIDAVVWSPYPVPEGIHWSRRMWWIRRRIAEFVTNDGRFDVVDVPPVAISRPLTSHCTVVARHVQPDLKYLWTELRYARRVRPLGIGAMIAALANNTYQMILVLRGWGLARRIFCLGTLDYEWMKRWFPWWRGKISMYANAVGAEDRRAIAEIRRARRPSSGARRRFLWIGRWSAQKGPDFLMSFIAAQMQRFPEDRVTIAGCGSEVERAIPPSLTHGGKVRVMAEYERRSLPELLADHDIGLFTSRVEGWGLTLQEMLESGMPVFATTAGAVADLRQAFPGLIHEFRPSLISSNPSADTRPLAGQYLERFSWDAIAEGYLKVVRQVSR